MICLLSSKSNTNPVKAFFLILNIFILLPFLSYSQNDEAELVGSWQEGSSYALEVSGDLAYVNSGSYLKILEIAKNDDPAILNSFLARGFIHSIKVKNGIAYLGIYSLGLQILDVSDLSQIKEIQFLPIEGAYPSLLIHDTFLYYSVLNHIHIIDISEKGNANILEDIESELWVRKMHLANNRMIGTAARDGVRIFDINENGSLNEVSVIQRTGLYVYDSEVVGNQCYIAGNDSIIIYDITDLENPSWYAGVKLSQASFLQAREGLIFAATVSPTNINVISIGDFAIPQIIQEWPIDMDGPVKNLQITEKHVFMVSASSTFLQANYSDGTINAAYNSNPGYSYSWDIEVFGNKAFLGQYNKGYALFNVEDPAAPEYLGTFGQDQVGIYYTRKDNYIYSVNLHEGELTIVDVSIADNPSTIGYLDIGGSLREIMLVDQIAYIADYTNGLILIDVSDPTSPNELSRLKPDEGNIFSVDIQGNYVYCGAALGGLIIYDVSDPNNPEIISTLNDIGRIGNVQVISDFAYVYPYDELGLIVDVSDPFNPFIVEGDISKEVRDIVFTNSHAYCISSTEGLVIYDITQPGEPSQLANFSIPGSAYRIVISNNHIYIADSWCGLFIISFDPLVNTESSSLAIKNEWSLYPNPFSQQIKLELDLIESSNVRIEIFDENMRLIKTLMDGELPGGKYYFVPDWQNEKQGLFVIKAKINDLIYSEKIVRIP